MDLHSGHESGTDTSINCLVTDLKDGSRPIDINLGLNVDRFDPTKISPAFYGHLFKPLADKSKEGPHEEYKHFEGSYDPSLIHPALLGLGVNTLVFYPNQDIKDDNVAQSEEVKGGTPCPKSCSAKQYVEAFIFPILLPALEKMLATAKENKVLERKRTKFNPCDFLTEYLYRNNKKFSGREDIILWDIPFVQKILEEHPRPPLPLSLLLTEEEAAIMIQSFWRGYVVRKDPEVQELREYQRQMREEEYDIVSKVESFWKQHPVEEPTEDEVNDIVNQGKTQGHENSDSSVSSKA